MTPTVLREGGFQFFFYSRESDEPPHIHVKKGGGYAKYWLEPVELANLHGFNPNERRQIEDLVAEHRNQLLESWHDYFGEDPPRHQR